MDNLEKKDVGGEEDKKLKKLLNAAIEVQKHKLGRTPTLEELQSSLSVEDDTTPASTLPAVGQKTPMASEAPVSKLPAGPQLEAKEDAVRLEKAPKEGDPRILRMVVYHGLDANRKSDPHKILFYEDPSTKECYSCESQQWLPERPSIVDHLPFRPIQFNERDIVASIMNGVMDDEGYSALKSRGMISEMPEKLWAMTRKLYSLNDQLEKSEAEKEEDGADDAKPDMEALEPMDLNGPTEHSGEDVVGDFMRTTGADVFSSEPVHTELPGQNVIDEIVKTSMSEAMLGFEDRVRQIVREELTNLFGSEENESEQVEPFNAVPMSANEENE